MSDDYRDLALQDAALDHQVLHEQYISALADRATYRWLYLEVVKRLLAAESKSASTERQIRQLLDLEQGEA